MNNRIGRIDIKVCIDLTILFPGRAGFFTPFAFTIVKKVDSAKRIMCHLFGHVIGVKGKGTHNITSMNLPNSSTSRFCLTGINRHTNI